MDNTLYEAWKDWLRYSCTYETLNIHMVEISKEAFQAGFDYAKKSESQSE